MKQSRVMMVGLMISMCLMSSLALAQSKGSAAQSLSGPAKEALMSFENGVRELNAGRDASAVIMFNRAIELDPSRIEYYGNRGFAYLGTKRFDKAAEDFSKTIEMNPLMPEAYYNRGLAYAAMAQYEKAVDDFSMAVEMDPKMTDGFANRALSYTYLKQYDKAWADMHQVETLGGKLNEQAVALLKQSSGRDK